MNEFFVDLMVTGTALGLDHTSGLAEVKAAFDVGEQLMSPRSLLTSGALLEFGWQRWHEGDEWRVTYFGAQAHRLAQLVQVDPPLVERYGEFPSHVHVDELRSAVAARGYPLEQVPTVNDGCVEYRAPVSGMHVLAIDPARADEPAPPGAVLKVLGPQEWWPWHRFAGREPEFKRHAKQLLPMSAAERLAWLDAHDPAGDRAHWWRCLTNMVARQGYDRPWCELGVVLHRESSARGVFTAGEAAVAEIGLLVLAHGREQVTLPADDAVRRWLDNVPVVDDLASARLLRTQIHEVRQGLALLTDPGLAEEVRPWLKVRRTFVE